jgi:putative hydrolase of HD superfamily
MSNGNKRLIRQIEFIKETDRLKDVLRQTYTAGGKRRENDAEHSWHLALMAILLHEHANTSLSEGDLLRVIKMLIIHDIVEIDAGDTFAYDDDGLRDKEEREEKAAQRLFSMLPPDQREEIYGLWREFEERKTPAARFAAALDRLQPMLLNYLSEGKAWKAHDVRSRQVYERNRHIEEGSSALWEFARLLIDDAVRKGYLDE